MRPGQQDRALTPGKRADIILVRTDTFGMTPLNNPIGAFVYNAHPGPRRHDPRRRQGREARRQAAGRRRRARAAARDRVARRHPAARGRRRTAPGCGGDWIPKAYGGRRVSATAAHGCRRERRDQRAVRGSSSTARCCSMRGVEDRVQSLFLRGEVYGTTHLYRAGSGRGRRSRARSRTGDRVACTYRGHGHAAGARHRARRRCSPSCSAARPA